MRYFSLLTLLLLIQAGFSDTIDVSTPYDTGTISLRYDKPVHLSNEAIINFCYADQTPYTGIGYNGDIFLSFLNPDISVEFEENTPLDTILFFMKNGGDDVDTIGIYPAFPVIDQVIIGELIDFPAEGYNRTFYLRNSGHHTLRCHVDSANLREIKWESDSLGNGIFPSDLIDTLTETVYDTFSVWACVNYPSRNTPNIEYDWDGIHLMHVFDENESVKEVEIIEYNELDGLAGLEVDTNRVHYRFNVYEEIEQLRENKEEYVDSFIYEVHTENRVTGDIKKYTVHNHVIFYLTHVSTLMALEKKQELNTTIHDKISIYSLNGRLVKEFRNSTLSNINTQTLSTGHYIISYSMDSKLIQKKFYVK